VSRLQGVLAGGTQEEQSLKTICKSSSMARGRRALLPAASCLLALFCLAVTGRSPEADEDKAAKAKAKPRPLAWHTSLEKATAAATERDRPILCVFWEAGEKAHRWFEGSSHSAGGVRFRRAALPYRSCRAAAYSRRRAQILSRIAARRGGDTGDGKSAARKAVKAADVVLLKIAPPPRFSPPLGAPAKEVELLRRASKLLWDRYAEVARKYEVTRVPTVLFLSPDGKTVLARYVRRSEAQVLAGLKRLDDLFSSHRKLRAAAAALKRADNGNGGSREQGDDARAGSRSETGTATRSGGNDASDKREKPEPPAAGENDHPGNRDRGGEKNPRPVEVDDDDF
jgi:hypothetical protein